MHDGCTVGVIIELLDVIRQPCQGFLFFKSILVYCIDYITNSNIDSSSSYFCGLIFGTGVKSRGMVATQTLDKNIRSHRPGNPLGMYWKRIKPS